MKSNIHKKLTFEDKFSRKWRVDGKGKARQIRYEKHHNSKELRRIYKRIDFETINNERGGGNAIL